MSGQWEQYVDRMSEAINEFWLPNRGLGSEPTEVDDALARRLLARIAPLIAEDTRTRMVEAAGRVLKREGVDRIAVSGYTVYPTGYHDTDIPSDKFHFTLKVENRGKGWAVVEGPFVLTVDGDWEHEPIPSSRDDEFFHRCRFTEEEAKRRAIEAVDKLTINGRTFAEAVRWVRERS